MMLSALYEYARRSGLLEDPDYEPKAIPLIAVITATGELQTLLDTREGKVAPELQVPRQPKRTSSPIAGFLVDNAKYVFGIDAPDGTKAAKLPDYVSAFRRLAVEAAADNADDVDLAAVVAFFGQHDLNKEKALRLRAPEEWTGSELIAFKVDGSGHAYAHESPGARAAWAKIRSTHQGPAAGAVRCLVTGDLAPALLTHPHLKRVPSAQSSGADIVSFNARAFESHGWEQGNNAPVSRAAAEGYVAALNDLLSADKSGRRYKGGVGLGSDAVVLVWTRDPAPELSSLLDLLDAPTVDAAKAVVEAPWKGLQPGSLDATRFYAVTLGGNAARVVVRDWFESTLGDVKDRVRHWFSMLDLEGSPRKGPATIWQLVSSLAPPGKNASLPPDLATHMAACALKGRPLPFELIHHCLARLRVPSEEHFKMHDRISIIKATLISHLNQEVSVSLDEANTSVPYLLGRLFAVLERTQEIALPDLNATIRDRFFGAAANTPSVIFPRLLRLSVHHSSKAEERGRWMEKLKGEVVDRLPPERFPKILGLEDQGLFAVGYYHQRQFFFRKRTPEAEQSTPVPNEEHPAATGENHV